MKNDITARSTHFDDAAQDYALNLTRRQFFGKAAVGIGVPALLSLLGEGNASAAPRAAANPYGYYGALPKPQVPPKIKRVIYLFQSGAPSHLDLFDYKPQIKDHQGVDLPASVRMGQRITGMTSGQAHFPCAASVFKFAPAGKNQTMLSELLPHTAGIMDDICLIKSMHTDSINHDPAVTHLLTGSEQPGRPSFGSWVSYGLGSENRDMPAFLVLISQGSGNRNDQPLFGRLWGSGFLPSVHQGVKLRAVGDPVLYLNNPQGLDRTTRRTMLDAVAKLNQDAAARVGDPEITTRIAQYEMAYRMQASVPDLMDLRGESPHTFEMYGPESRTPGTFAANCLLARRLVEKGVRFVQLFHRGWDQHGNLPSQIRGQARDTDQPSAALIKDLKQRGLLDETLVIWGGEFGRTVYCQGELTTENYGRDHHGRCYSIWMAGGGVKPGMVLGETDDFGYNITRDPVDTYDLNATILHLLGVDHTRLTYRYQGRDFRLTDVAGQIIKPILT